jgi:iron complex transport system ATP-binding protein
VSVASLELGDLTVRYGPRTALRGVSLRAYPGEFLALVGPNGSGKTTLLRSVIGLGPGSSEGRVAVLGATVDSLSYRERARRVAWLPQDESPQDNVAVFDYVLYGRYAHVPPFGREDDRDRDGARRALRSVGLWDRRGAGIRELSGGERQRVLLARALAQDTPLLLLDEPTTHLDIGHQLDLLERVRALCRGQGKCVVAAMHDLNLSVRFADRMAVLSRGRLVEDGPAREVLSVPLLRTVWGVDAEIKSDPANGVPYVLPARLAPTPSGPGDARSIVRRSRGSVHVVGGGGSATPILRRLVEDGFSVSAGALHLLDSDSETARELGIPFVAEIPFAPLGEDVRERHRALLAEARAIVVASFAVGPGNLANLEDARAVAGRQPVYLLPRIATAPWDFTDGRATELWAALKASGAREVSDLDALVAALDEEGAARSSPLDASAPGPPTAAASRPSEVDDAQRRRVPAREGLQQAR